MIITLRNINKTYPGAVPLHVLKDINLDIERGELVSIMGASGSGKSEILFRELIDKAMDNPNKNYIILVPEQFTLETQKKVVTMHKCGAVANIDIVSFNRLSFRVFEELGIGNPDILDDTGKSLILRKVIASESRNLNIYRDKVHMHGFVEEMKSVISELYMYGIGIEKYKEIRTLLESLEIPTQFAALGASNAFQFQGTLPEDKEALAAALDKIIETVKEDDLREYRVNLRHL